MGPLWGGACCCSWAYGLRGGPCSRSGVISFMVRLRQAVLQVKWHKPCAAYWLQAAVTHCIC